MAFQLKLDRPPLHLNYKLNTITIALHLLLFTVMTFRTNLHNLSKSPLWADCATPKHGRDLIGSLYQSLLLAPQQLRVKRFEAMSERELSELARMAGEGLQAQGIQSLLHPSKEYLFETAVGLLRYLDETVNDSPEVLNADALQRLKYDDYWVVPCRHRNHSKRGQMFRRRALRYHHVIPSHLDGFECVLNIHTDLASSTAPDRHMLGGGIFPEFNLASEILADGKFIATGAECENQCTLIDHQLDSARQADCSLVIWPELTMPPEALSAVSESLGNKHLRSGLPAVVVAGSWHNDEDGKRFNRCSIMDRRGSPLFTQDKGLSFFERKETSPEEAIDDTKTINLLVTERDVIGIFICLDYCHSERLEFLKGLGLSLAIVPSMGGNSTMFAHQQNAKELARATDLETIVVQQVLASECDKVGGSGFVWAHSSRAREHEPAPTTEQFTTFQL